MDATICHEEKRNTWRKSQSVAQGAAQSRGAESLSLNASTSLSTRPAHLVRAKICNLGADIGFLDQIT